MAVDDDCWMEQALVLLWGCIVIKQSTISSLVYTRQMRLLQCSTWTSQAALLITLLLAAAGSSTTAFATLAGAGLVFLAV